MIIQIANVEFAIALLEEHSRPDDEQFCLSNQETVMYNVTCTQSQWLKW